MQYGIARSGKEDEDVLNKIDSILNPINEILNSYY